MSWFCCSCRQHEAIIGDVATFIGLHFNNGLPSKDYVRPCMARNPSITVYPFATVENAKLNAQHLEHVMTYKPFLEQVQTFHPGIFLMRARYGKWTVQRYPGLCEKNIE